MSLEAVFDRHADGHGQLSLSGYARLVNEAQPAGTESISKSKLSARFAALDADKSGLVDKKEYVCFSLLEALTQERGRMLDLLDSWDSDRNRRVDADEFRVAIKKLGLVASEEYVNALFAALDEDGNGTIEFKEVSALAAPLCQKSPAPLMPSLQLSLHAARHRAAAVDRGAQPYCATPRK